MTRPDIAAALRVLAPLVPHYNLTATEVLERRERENKEGGARLRADFDASAMATEIRRGLAEMIHIIKTITPPAPSPSTRVRVVQDDGLTIPPPPQPWKNTEKGTKP